MDNYKTTTLYLGLEENKKYILHELYAPEGFVIALDTEFIVSEDKQTQEITLIDKIVGND